MRLFLIFYRYWPALLLAIPMGCNSENAAVEHSADDWKTYNYNALGSRYNPAEKDISVENAKDLKITTPHVTCYNPSENINGRVLQLSKAEFAKFFDEFEAMLSNVEAIPQLLLQYSNLSFRHFGPVASNANNVRELLYSSLQGGPS